MRSSSYADHTFKAVIGSHVDGVREDAAFRRTIALHPFNGGRYPVPAGGPGYRLAISLSFGADECYLGAYIWHQAAEPGDFARSHDMEIITYTGLSLRHHCRWGEHQGEKDRQIYDGNVFHFWLRPVFRVIREVN